MLNRPINDFLSDLSEKSQQLIFSKISKEVLKKDDHLWRIGDPGENLVIIVSGLIELISRDKQGRNVYLAVFGPNDILGLPALHLDSAYIYDCRVIISNTVVLKVPIKSILANCKDHYIVKEIEIWIRNRLLSHDKIIMNKIYILAAKSIDYKLFCLLENLNLRFGQMTDKADISRIPMLIPKISFAQLTDSRIETVVRVFSKWKKHELINWDSEQGILLNLVKIELEATAICNYMATDSLTTANNNANFISNTTLNTNKNSP